MEVVGIPSSVKDDALEDKIFNAFQEIGAEIGQRDIQACQRMKNNRSSIAIYLTSQLVQKYWQTKVLIIEDCGINAKLSRIKANFTNFAP